MDTYLVTGAASGMGQALAQRLRTGGHRVIGVDLTEAETVDVPVVADLSMQSGRAHAVAEVLAACDGVLDGAALAAGRGPGVRVERQIVEVNVLGTTELLAGLRPALAAGRAKVVVFGSNSTTSTPLVPRRAVRLLARGDTERAARVLARRGRLSGPASYAASKIAVTRWCREQAVTAEWAGAGIRLNVLAPGPVMTPLLSAQLEGPEAAHVRSFPVPTGGWGSVEQLVDWASLMLSPAAEFMVGSVVTVDGGTEALLRPRAWPSPMPWYGVPRLLRAMRRSSPRERQTGGQGDHITAE